jgi:hypothetical protein
MSWRCYFETADGLVLTAAESFATAEEAASWGTLVLKNPDDFALEDPDDELVPATRAAVWAGVTVELVEPALA